MTIYKCTDKVEFETPAIAREILGGKGAGLFEMRAMGVPVPEFLVIPAQLCVDYMGGHVTQAMVTNIAKQAVEFFTDEQGSCPLLSVRSGARVSLPGMMDTVLNVGVNTESCANYIADMPERVVLDCHRRFLHMFGSTVVGIADKKFEDIISTERKKANADTDADLTDKQMETVVAYYVEAYHEEAKVVPPTLVDQVAACIYAVMNSWNSPRAIEYRKQNKIPHDWGTAVVIQRMVFGNFNNDSGSGVLFSRDPATGENKMTGEFLPNAQGEDVVAGIRTPMNLSEMAGLWPKVSSNLANIVDKLEQSYGDMLDIEFTVENKELYFLQVRVGKRSARAAVRIALDMHKDGQIDLATLKKRIKRDQLKVLMKPVISPDFKTEAHFSGIPACAGVVTGEAVFTAEAAVAAKAEGKDVILIRHETSPDDIAGMFAAIGILTATGGSTSHAAVVARGMDKTCIPGATGLQVADHHADFKVDGESKIVINKGDKVTLDGATGRVWVKTDVPVSDPKDLTELQELSNVLMPSGSFQYFPGQNGPNMVYSLSQFMQDVEAPVTPDDHEVTVIVDQGMTDEDPLLMVTDGFDFEHCMRVLVAWLAQYGRKANLYVPAGLTSPLLSSSVINVVEVGSNIKGMMVRPVSMDQLVRVFGDMETLVNLISPSKVDDKFNIFRCGQYEMLAAFE